MYRRRKTDESYFQFPTYLHLATFLSTIVSPMVEQKKRTAHTQYLLLSHKASFDIVICVGKLSQQLQFQRFVAESGNTTLRNTTRST
jgi:hypothetical protein